MDLGPLLLISVTLVGIVGMFIGFLIAAIALVPHTSGTLHVDQTNPENIKYLFEIDELDKLGSKGKVTLKINNQANLSQE